MASDSTWLMKAGVKTGDVIVEYGGRKIARSDQLPRAVAETPIGREVPLTVVRNGKTVTLTVKIAELTEPRQRAIGTPSPKASLGLVVRSLTPQLARQLGIPDTGGVLVERVEESGPAATAGIQPGDVIVEVDRHRVSSAEDLRRYLGEHPKGTPVLLLVHRRGTSLYVAVGG